MRAVGNRPYSKKTKRDKSGSESMTKTDQKSIDNIHEKGKPSKTRDEMSYPYKLTGRVVTYDPIHGTGRIKVENPGALKERARFLYEFLPEDIQNRIKEAMLPIGSKKKRKGMPLPEINKHRSNAISLIMGKRFRFEARAGRNDRPVIKRGSMEELR